jgi:hypothetical protein
MQFEEVEGELCVIDENNEIIHVFERENLSRAAYKHMICWIKTNFDSKLSFGENWSKAEAAWDALTPENKMLLWSLSNQEDQCAQDICTGLLATLSEYQGLTHVKKAFNGAIKKVMDQFTSSSPSTRSASEVRTRAHE